MRHPLSLCLLLGLAACSLTEEKFVEDVPEALCAYYQSCDPPFYSDEGACTEEIEGDLPEPDAGCVWDKDAATQCLDELEGLTCEGSASNVPTVCSEVYDCTGEDSDTDGGS